MQQSLRGEGGAIQYFQDEGRILYEGTWHFIGELDKLWETMLCYLTKFMRGVFLLSQ